jgi:hypothetical protein
VHPLVNRPAYLGTRTLAASKSLRAAPLWQAPQLDALLMLARFQTDADQ